MFFRRNKWLHCRYVCVGWIRVIHTIYIYRSLPSLPPLHFIPLTASLILPQLSPLLSSPLSSSLISPYLIFPLTSLSSYSPLLPFSPIPFSPLISYLLFPPLSSPLLSVHRWCYANYARNLITNCLESIINNSRSREVETSCNRYN